MDNIEQHIFETERILICNAGSGSLELQEWEESTKLNMNIVEGEPKQLFDHFKKYIDETLPYQIILHRVVHVGKVDRNPKLVDEDCLNLIRHWSPLAPLHNEIALRLIEYGIRECPHAKHFIFSDSTLFNTIPDCARHYALPEGLSEKWPIMRYGFHGLAHQSQWNQLQKQKKYERVITIHLGGGSSLAAWKGGIVIDTTMGFTPSDGLPMTTRSGSIDPNIVLHLLEREEHTPESLSRLFNHSSGLAGISGISGDYRDLKKSESGSASVALEIYSYALTKAIGAFVGVMGGVDAIVFGGGLGEHQPDIRADSLCQLSKLGISLCEKKNRSAQGICALHQKHSQTEIWLIPSDECLEMLGQYKRYSKETV